MENMMEDESGTVDVLAMGDSMSIDYGVLIAINSTSSSNCTIRFKNGCSPREKLHFRFWPGMFCLDFLREICWRVTCPFCFVLKLNIDQ
jgi:hypothetical protein